MVTINLKNIVTPHPIMSRILLTLTPRHFRIGDAHLSILESDFIQVSTSLSITNCFEDLVDTFGSAGYIKYLTSIQQTGRGKIPLSCLWRFGYFEATIHTPTSMENRLYTETTSGDK